MNINLRTVEGNASAASTTASHAGLRLRYLCYAALVAVVILFAVIRIRLRTMPLERDEGEYVYAGQLMLEGIAPYRLAYNMKLPGTYAAYAALMAVFGQSVTGIRLGMLLVNATTMLLVFLLGRRLFGVLAGTVAAATYALLSNRTSMFALDGHATHFVALAAVAGTLLLLQALDTRRKSLLFASGLLYGLAFLMKQPGILFGVFGMSYWLWSERRASERRKLISGAAALSAGIALPLLCTCILLWHAGVFEGFWFWTYSYGREYGALTSFSAGWGLFRKIVPWIVRPFVIWGLAAFGLSAVLWSPAARKWRVFLVGFLGFSFLAVCPGLYFRSHYFLVMLPAVALLAGVGIEAAREKLVAHGKLAAALPSIFFALTFVTVIYGHRKFLFEMSPADVAERVHAGDGCAEAESVAGYIEQHTTRQDAIAVLGSEPEIYFYARRHSATGYIYMYGLMEQQKFAQRMQAEMIGQIEAARPRFLVYTDDELSWGWSTPGAEKDRLFDWMRRYLDASYGLAATIPINGVAQHRWGTQPAFYIFELRQ